MKGNFFSRNKYSLLICLCLSAVNVLLVFIFDVSDYSFEFKGIQKLLYFISMILFFGFIVFDIFCRIKRYTTLIKGVFYYQFIGSLAYIVFFIAFMLGRSDNVSIITNIYKWWSLPISPFVTILSRITGISLTFSLGLSYLLITYLTGRTVISIKKDISFEEKRKQGLI